MKNQWEKIDRKETGTQWSANVALGMGTENPNYDPENLFRAKCTECMLSYHNSVTRRYIHDFDAEFKKHWKQEHTIFKRIRDYIKK